MRENPLTHNEKLTLGKVVARYILRTWSDLNVRTLIQMSEEEVRRMHFTFGIHIRNYYHLWDYPWEPEIRDRTDCSNNHPDVVSNDVMVYAWEALVDLSNITMNIPHLKILGNRRIH